MPGEVSRFSCKLLRWITQASGSAIFKAPGPAVGNKAILALFLANLTKNGCTLRESPFVLLAIGVQLLAHGCIRTVSGVVPSVWG